MCTAQVFPFEWAFTIGPSFGYVSMQRAIDRAEVLATAGIEFAG